MMAFLMILKAKKTAGLQAPLFFVLSTLLPLVAASVAEEPPARLELADRIRLIEFGDGSQRPYFRTEFNIVNENGSAVSVIPPQDPNAALEIVEANGSAYHPLSLHYVQE